MKRMMHPLHGWHVPMPSEREEMLKNGWIDEDPPVEEKAPEPEQPKRRGRPPKAKE